MDLSKRDTTAREVRRWSVDNCELRAGDGDGDTLTLIGEASVVEAPYTVRDMFGEFRETIAAGAFDKTLSESPDVVLLVNHEGLPLARTTSGTMSLSADPSLSVSASLDRDDPDVARIERKMRRGDLNEMSFAFRVIRQEWNEDYTDRRILEVSLHRGDVSVVNYGSNPATSAALRSLDAGADELDDAIAALRSGDATEVQIDLVARIAAQLSDLLPTPAQVPEAILADLADLADKFPPPLDPAA